MQKALESGITPAFKDMECTGPTALSIPTESGVKPPHKHTFAIENPNTGFISTPGRQDACGTFAAF
ncbi:MAG: hypothetical protein WC334_02310 [Kiritimatiellales bacterium]